MKARETGTSVFKELAVRSWLVSSAGSSWRGQLTVLTVFDTESCKGPENPSAAIERQGRGRPRRAANTKRRVFIERLGRGHHDPAPAQTQVNSWETNC